VLFQPPPSRQPPVKKYKNQPELSGSADEGVYTCVSEQARPIPPWPTPNTLLRPVRTEKGTQRVHLPRARVR